MKRAKQTQKMIDAVNCYLKVNHITNEFDHVFSMFCYALIQADQYRGYNLQDENGCTDPYKAPDHLFIY